MQHTSLGMQHTSKKGHNQRKPCRLHEKLQEIPTERTRYSSCYKFNASVDLLRQYQLYLQPQRSGYTIMIPLMIQTVNNVVYATMKVKKLSIIVLQVFKPCIFISIHHTKNLCTKINL